MRKATPGSSALAVTMGSRKITSPWALRTSSMKRGPTRQPPLAKGANAATSAMGVTSAAPRNVAGYDGIGSAIPQARAASMTFCTPTCSPSATAARFEEMRRPSRSETRRSSGACPSAGA